MLKNEFLYKEEVMEKSLEIRQIEALERIADSLEMLCGILDNPVIGEIKEIDTTEIKNNKE